MNVFPSKRYNKSLKRVLKNGRVKITEIDFIVDVISSGQRPRAKYHDHALLGEYEGYRECHIKPDVLLVYKIEKNILVLLLADIGSHSDLF